MKVYVVLNNVKSWDGLADVYEGVYASRKQAEESLSGYGKWDRMHFRIEEEEIYQEDIKQ